MVAGIERYMKLLAPDAIPDLCELLARVESRRGRRVMCAVLIHLAKGRIDPFLPFLKDERWFLVRNVLTILGQMKNPSAVKHIRSFVGHGEIRVRREALTALSLIGEREAVEALVTSLRDTDFRIRVSAARSLSRLGRTGLNPILQVVLARDFESRSFEEKRGFFEALGRTNAPELIQFLRVLLDKRPLFKKTEAEEMRVCAVEALSRMKLPEARVLLAAAASDPSSIVRAAVGGATKRQEEDEEGDDV
jgi:HEAT repeat protein